MSANVQGCDAYYAGLELKDNPYDICAGWEDYCDWQDGFQDAERLGFDIP